MYTMRIYRVFQGHFMRRYYIACMDHIQTSTFSGHTMTPVMCQTPYIRLRVSIIRLYWFWVEIATRIRCTVVHALLQRTDPSKSLNPANSDFRTFSSRISEVHSRTPLKHALNDSSSSLECYTYVLISWKTLSCGRTVVCKAEFKLKKLTLRLHGRYLRIPLLQDPQVWPYKILQESMYILHIFDIGARTPCCAYPGKWRK